MTRPALPREAVQVRPFHHGRNVYREQRDRAIRMMPIVRPEQRLRDAVIAALLWIVALVVLVLVWGAVS